MERSTPAAATAGAQAMPGINVKANKLVWEAPSQALFDGVELSSDEAQYMLPHFNMILVGKPGSGKTQLLMQLMSNKHLYRKRFDYVYLVSPSYAKMGIKIPDSHMTGTFDLPWVFERIALVNEKQQQKIFKDQQAMYPQSKAKRIEAAAGNSKKGAAAANNPHGKDSQRFGLESIKDAVAQQSGRTLVPMAAGAKEETKTGAGKPGSSAHSQIMGGREQQRMYEEVRKMQLPLQKSTHANVLFVFDDVIGSIKKSENDPRIAELFMNRRHLIFNGTVSIIVVSQKYTLVPARIRSTASWIVLFRLNPKDFELAYEDAILLSKTRWMELLRFVFGAVPTGEASSSSNGRGGGGSDKYANLGVWVEKNKFFKNFQEIDVAHAVNEFGK